MLSAVSIPLSPRVARPGGRALWQPLLVGSLALTLAATLGLGGVTLALYSQLVHEQVEQQALREEMATAQAEAIAAQAEAAATEADLRALMERTTIDQQAELAELAAALDAEASAAEGLRQTLMDERLRKQSIQANLEKQRALADRYKGEGETLAALTDEQRRQIEERDAHLAALNDQVSTMQRRIDEMETLAARVREMLGISVVTGPAGGDEQAAPIGQQTADLEGRLVELTDRSAYVSSDLASLERAVRERLVAFQQVMRVNPQVRPSARAMLAAPAGWPAQGPITSVFGMRQSPFDGVPRFHGGVDIAVPMGAPVRATADGEVILAGAYGEYGLAVVMRHSAGFETLTGHHSQILVRPGQVVKRGQVVALGGSTGASTGPHVHYEVRYQGQLIDAEPFLALARD